jgi:glycosyltransferase involved in cell wall biosynthesis
MSGFEENEISKNAFGGTELAKRKLANLLDPNLLDEFQIICSRPRDLQEDKIRVFWCHDLPEDPESAKFRDPNWRNQFHKFVFISNWQYQRYQLIHGLDLDSKSIVLETGIEPATREVFDMKEDKPIRLVYTSTPQRGLELLIPVFEKLCEVHDDIHLDVFSSFKIYGWDDADKQYEHLYDRIRNNPKATYHGFVPNDELKEHLNKSHIFAYPSIWYETSCRAMLEAMSAGLICVHSNLAALPETSGGLNMMYHIDLNDKIKHLNVFASHLNMAIQMVRDKQHIPMAIFSKEFVDRRYNINLIKMQWENLLSILKDQYPTAESRAIPKQQFVYKTS